MFYTLQAPESNWRSVSPTLCATSSQRSPLMRTSAIRCPCQSCLRCPETAPKTLPGLIEKSAAAGSRWVVLIKRVDLVLLRSVGFVPANFLAGDVSYNERNGRKINHGTFWGDKGLRGMRRGSRNFLFWKGGKLWIFVGKVRFQWCFVVAGLKNLYLRHN